MSRTYVMTFAQFSTRGLDIIEDAIRFVGAEYARQIAIAILLKLPPPTPRRAPTPDLADLYSLLYGKTLKKRGSRAKHASVSAAPASFTKPLPGFVFGIGSQGPHYWIIENGRRVLKPYRRRVGGAAGTGRTGTVVRGRMGGSTKGERMAEKAVGAVETEAGLLFEEAKRRAEARLPPA